MHEAARAHDGSPGKLLFVALVELKAGLDEQLERRSSWRWPDGVRMIGEYWMPGSVPQAIIVIEAADEQSVIAAARAWTDLLEIRVLPALAADEVLRLARQVRRVGLARRTARFAASADRITRALSAP